MTFVFRDQLSRRIELQGIPVRVVSLCPSTTETLFALGLGASVVGRTDYCCEPAAEVEAVATVGGTKKVRADAIAELHPDLIVSVREENDRDQVERLATMWPTFILDPVDVPSAIEGIEVLANVLGGSDRGVKLATEIRNRFETLPSADGIRVAYLIWRKPYMVAGAGTYLDDVLTRLGFTNVGRELEGRYPELSAASVQKLKPDVLLASSEPFPFDTRHLDELRGFAPCARAILADGQAFSWHGARMRHATTVFADLLRGLGVVGC